MTLIILYFIRLLLDEIALVNMVCGQKTFCSVITCPSLDYTRFIFVFPVTYIYPVDIVLSKE